ncbi:hypothetical protein F5B20DRAFT_583569 [Whalleya microplaca]|nr:hypothetical protein F5B20DRAFT_583569 [Whalleya microplaca]
MEQKLIIGIDLRTTFSGVASAFTCRNPDDIRMSVIRKWPTLPTRGSKSEKHKVPSRIHYMENGKISWGYNIPDDIEPLQWIKLLLLEEDELPDYLRQSQHLESSQRKLKVLKKSAVTVVGDLLKLIWNHALTRIAQIYGEGLVDATPFHVVFTVPAIWPEYAHQKMREAAIIADILDDRLCGETTVSFISEPEAAAIECLHSDLRARSDLKADDVFVVCDCGGGTVDVISYAVKQAAPRVVIGECVEGEGDLCGATILDEAFENDLEAVIGPTDWDNMSMTTRRAVINDSWEDGIKPNFDGSEGPWVVKMPNGRNIEFAGQEIADCFKDSVMPKITQLVHSQVKRVIEETEEPPKFLILLGGFGQSRYLRLQLQRSLQRNKAMKVGKIQILQPDSFDTWSAVCQGAVRSAAIQYAQADAAIQLDTRKARYSYGWTYSADYDETNPSHQANKVWDSVRCEWRVPNQIYYFIRRGEDVDANAKVLYYDKQFGTEVQGVKKFTEVLYKSEKLKPSSDPADGDITKISDVNLTTSVPVEDLPTEENTLGDDVRVFNYKWRVVVSGATVDAVAYSEDGTQIGQLKFVVDI